MEVIKLLSSILPHMHFALVLPSVKVEKPNVHVCQPNAKAYADLYAHMCKETFNLL